jgi:hypothetical protein
MLYINTEGSDVEINRLWQWQGDALDSAWCYSHVNSYWSQQCSGCNVQSAGSVDQVLSAHRNVLDAAGDASSASSRCSTPDPPSQSPKSTVPPHGDDPPTPTHSPSTEEVTLRNKLPADGEFCIGPRCVGCSASKVSWLIKMSPLALQLNAQCDLQQTRI